MEALLRQGKRPISTLAPGLVMPLGPSRLSMATRSAAQRSLLIFGALHDAAKLTSTEYGSPNAAVRPIHWASARRPE